jgi:hypothetical protein
MTRRFHDGEERATIAAYERGEFKPVKGQKVAKKAAIGAARRYLRKDARTVIRPQARPQHAGRGVRDVAQFL